MMETGRPKEVQGNPYLVELKHGKLDLLMLVLDLLGGGVVLLLALLGTTTQAQHQVECRLCTTRAMLIKR